MTRVDEATRMANGKGTSQRFRPKVSFFIAADSLRFGAIAILLFCNTTSANDATPGLIPTMSYNRPVPIEANGEAIDLGHHVVTRCYDWDQDGNLDLLVGGGDGRLWLYRNSGTRQKALFEA